MRRRSDVRRHLILSRIIGVLALVSAAALLLGPGCENPACECPNCLPFLDVEEEDTTTPPKDVTTDTSGNPDGTGGPCGCVKVGSFYRFTKLKLLTIDNTDHPVIGTLNPMWQADINKFELNILLKVTEVTEDKIAMQFMNAARVGTDGGMCLLPHTVEDLVLKRNGCQLESEGESNLNVFAGAQAHPKNCTTTLPVQHAIPISRLLTTAESTDDCSRIIKGKVSNGMMAKAALSELCTCITVPDDMSDVCGPLDASFVDVDGFCKGCNDTYMNLLTLLDGYGTLNFECEMTDGTPGACLTAEYEADLLASAPPECP